MKKADNFNPGKWLVENKITSQSKIDENVHLDDSSGELSGAVVNKMEYVKQMLNSAIQEKNWNKVEDAIFFIDAM
jgi:hypothetical protein